jgi:signal transduction histidine kinase
VTALRLLLGRLDAPGEDEAPPARLLRRDRIVDCGLVLLALALGSVSLVNSNRHGLHGSLLAVDAVCGVALSLALWWRRRRAVALGLVSLPLLAVSAFAGPAAVIILFTVAAHRRSQLTFLVAGLQLALLPVARAVHPEGESTESYYLVGTLGTAVIVAWGMFLRSRRQAESERLHRSQVEEQARVEQIRHAERTRIAREMHDVLAHRISLLSLHAGALEFRPDAAPEEIARAAAVIRASAHQALEDLRAVIGLLRDGTPDEAPQPPQPTLAALPALLEESRAVGTQLNADVRVPEPAAVPDAIGRHAFRIIQEALTNARKHAPSAPVDLRVEGAPGEGLTISVRNPAPVLTGGTVAIPGSGTGLVGLAERVTLSGGHLEHGPDEHGDFRLRAWLPWPG